jgi:serine/threonine protein kinase
VYSFTDPDYGIKFAVKRAKKGLDERDLHRFKRELETLKRLRHPYIVEVYRYDETRNEYMMEYCDETLRAYIARRNP